LLKERTGIMVDEIFDRGYQSGRAELHAGIDNGLARIARSFGDGIKVLHRIQWSAPWNGTNKRARCG
jgi:hypothetical protein